MGERHRRSVDLIKMRAEGPALGLFDKVRYPRTRNIVTLYLCRKWIGAHRLVAGRSTGDAVETSQIADGRLGAFLAAAAGPLPSSHP
jgi:hypothetical protein